MPVAFVRDENRGVQKRPPGVVIVVLVVIVVIVIVVVVREKSQQQHTQIVRDDQSRFYVLRCLSSRSSKGGEGNPTRKRVCGFDLSLFSLVSRTRKVRKRSKNVLTKRFFLI